MTWAERAETDPVLRQFVNGEIARACIELHSLRAEVAHLHEVNAALTGQLAECKAGKRK